MYATKNYQTKKELKQAVQMWNELKELGELAFRQKYGMMPSMIGAMRGLRLPQPVTYFQPNDMGFTPKIMTGKVLLEGPHYPKPHKWYAECIADNGFIVKVR